MLNNPATVIQKLLDAQTATNSGGRFRLESNGKIMHVIPVAIKNSVGELTPQESPLDTIISLPTEERTIEQKVETICTEISRATNIRVEVGTIPTNLLRQHRYEQGALRQKARDILVNILETLNNGTKLSWRLLYDPGMKTYALNIHTIES
jgi:hypothetical protein